MTTIINYLTSHPIALGIAVIISLMIVLSFARRILRFALVLVALGILYVAWVSWHGGDPAEKAQKAGKTVKSAVHKGEGVMKVVDWLFKSDDDKAEDEGKK
jgi:ABC-type transport system involved in cytochrome bd biosynthesis fused ATPase/permease subunit